MIASVALLGWFAVKDLATRYSLCRLDRYWRCWYGYSGIILFGESREVAKFICIGLIAGIHWLGYLAQLHIKKYCRQTEKNKETAGIG